MTSEEYLEFLVMLQVENKCQKDKSFYNYVDNKCSISKFNTRYDELLDKFLNKYA